MSKLGLVINEIIKELIDDYKQSPISYLTEGDVVATLACILRRGLARQSVHTGLCPVRGTQEAMTGKSKEFGVARRECAVDIAELGREPIKRTVDGYKEKKYWRYLDLHIFSAFSDEEDELFQHV